MKHTLKEFITKSGTFLVIVNEERYYEFRDLTPRDLIWIDYLNEADNEDYKDFISSLEFLICLAKRLIICSNYEIDNEDWPVFMDISKRVQENVFAQCIPWKSFLGLVFALGHKSFVGIQDYMDMPMTTIHDMQQVLVEYYEAQEAAMNSAQGIHK